MKRAILAVLAVAFVAASCGGDGGGNINKVKNGVFSNYDNTITLGKALENNSTLKGGKWGTVEKEGRNFVTYTVRLTKEQIADLLNKANTQHKNFWAANTFFERCLNGWKSRNAEALARLTSMTAEEVNQAHGIFKAALDKRNIAPSSDNYLFQFVEEYKYPDRYETFRVLKDEYYGPWFLAHEDRSDFRASMTRTSYFNLIQYGFDSSHNKGRLLVQDGMLTDDLLEMYQRWFQSESQNIELQKEIAATMLRLYPEYEKMMEEYETARNNDFDPMLTIDGFEIVLSFVMNQDDTFAPNLMETYTEITLNCFDNLKVRFMAGGSSNNNAQVILDMIYKSNFFSPSLF